jgi:hypothetical protein
MKMMIKTTSSFLAFVISLTFSALSVASHGRGSHFDFEPDETVVEGFDTFEAYIDALPRSGLNRGLRNSLVKKLDNAEAAYERSKPCTAVNILGAFLNHAQALRRGNRTVIAEELHARGWMLRHDLLSSLTGEQSCKGFERFGTESAIDVAASDNQHLAGTVQFGTPTMWNIATGGEMWTALEIPGIADVVSESGLPGVPMMKRLVAIPQGAEISVRAVPHAAETLSLNLFPLQPPAEANGRAASNTGEAAVDKYFGDEPPPRSIFFDPSFTKNEEVYSSDAPYPGQTATVRLLGQSRDLQIAELVVAAGQYNPTSDKLTLFESVDFEVSFRGGNGNFVTEASLNPFESNAAAIAGMALNKDVVLDYVGPDVLQRFDIGEELMILTHPSFRAAADALAQWKRNKGILTNVYEVNDGAGPGPDTNEQIDDLIEDRYATAIVRPSYILLLGDAEFIPTFYKQRFLKDLGVMVATDYPYSAFEQFANDVLLDFAVGRIPVDTLSQAQIVVGKIIAYEQTPPMDPDFYQWASFASHFERRRDDPDTPEDETDMLRERYGFIRKTEQLRNLLLFGGKSVERIYSKDPLAFPLFYSDYTPLPQDLLPANFAWDGGTADVVSALNGGRFLMYQMDHGWSGGWGAPAFSTSDMGGLVNGDLLPLILSMNCSSGFFDNETDGDSGSGYNDVYFTEALLRHPDGGAVGILAGTRMTNTWYNEVIATGFLDAVWPYFAPNFGNFTSIRRVGDILNHGKMYMMQEIAGTSLKNFFNSLNHLMLYHAMGDPSLPLRTSRPIRMAPNYTILEVSPDDIAIGYSIEGATITVLQASDAGYVPIGRGVVQDGATVLPYVLPPNVDGQLLVSASIENGISRLLTSTLPADLPMDLPDEVPDR